jgi:hypothetical protein
MDLGSLKEYVTGQSRMQQVADSTVLLQITHNHLKARFPEIRLDLHVSPHGMAVRRGSWAGRPAYGVHRPLPPSRRLGPCLRVQALGLLPTIRPSLSHHPSPLLLPPR